MDRVTRIKATIPSPYPLTAVCVGTHDTKTFRFGLLADATLDQFPGDHHYVHRYRHYSDGLDHPLDPHEAT